MTTCRDCIHYDVCKDYKWVERQGKLSPSYNCPYIKDKSRFIELPCKVNETIHYITFWNNKYDYHFITNVSYDILYQLLHEKEIGYVVFMTDEKSKAEAKLKELNENENA